MKIREEFCQLINEFRTVDKKAERFKEISAILTNKYKMSAYSQLALFRSPPVLEYSLKNKYLIFEKEEKEVTQNEVSFRTAKNSMAEAQGDQETIRPRCCRFSKKKPQP